jgi:hypothetical protein
MSQEKDPVKTRWKQLRNSNGFSTSDTYKGPKTDGLVDPSTINDKEQASSGNGNFSIQPYQGIPLTDRQIKQGRKTKKNAAGNGGSGSIQEDPNIVPAEKIEVPEIDSSTPKPSEVSSFSKTIWMWVGIIVIALALTYIIYMIVKNNGSQVERIVPFTPLEEDLNPATISKTELQLRLEEAIQNENYKECVRIYFLFSMKELIERRQIFWKKEKTNMHYLIEMQGKNGCNAFEKIVTVYDLVWYGDYNVDKISYSTLQPDLEHAYQSILQAI